MRQKTDVELDALKDKLRKLEQETEKLKSENTVLREGENQIQKAYKEEVNKVHQLVLELKEAKAEIDELESWLTVPCLPKGMRHFTFFRTYELIF